jgi:TRAP-type C4-dicarboxylate transport system permease small subunit
MTFHQIKTGITCAILGAVLATGGYMLATASYVGSSTDLILTPRFTDKGTQWNAEDKQIAVEVRQITSLIEKPTITIKKKQQWLPLAICLGSGFLIAYMCYKIAMRKSQSRHDEQSSTESTTPEKTEPIQ